MSPGVSLSHIQDTDKQDSKITPDNQTNAGENAIWLVKKKTY